MGYLEEDVLFGSSELSMIKKVYNQSNLKNTNYNGLDEKQSQKVQKILDSVKKKSKAAGNGNDFCFLKALSAGPDTNSNSLLKYVVKAPKVAWNYPDRVLMVCELMQTGQIKDNLDCLYNNSVYADRTSEEFRYTVMAFNAIVNKFDDYFDGKEIKISTNKQKLKSFFPDVYEDVEYAVNSSNSYEDAEKFFNGKAKYFSVNVPVDVKYFYSQFQPRENGKIISAGMNQASEDRTIWNYMDIWSNPSDETTEDKADKDNDRASRSKSNTVDKIKNILKNSRVDEKSAEAINDLLDLL